MMDNYNFNSMMVVVIIVVFNMVNYRLNVYMYIPYIQLNYLYCISIRKQIIEENRYLDEKENIRQRSADRYESFVRMHLV